MTILPVEQLKINYGIIDDINEVIKSTFRLILFSRNHLADDLLNTFLERTTNLRELLSIKNAQMEAQSEEELEDYLIALRKTLNFIVEEIKANKDFTNELQLFQLIRLISNEAHLSHPNRYRSQMVQIGRYICPKPMEVPSLVTELFHNTTKIEDPIVRAIYFHHELIRIHPFSDGNGRTTRIAKNWMLMFNLYPPIFIRDENEKKEYIETLSNSFSELEKNPNQWNNHLEDFFNQEMNRILTNAQLVHESVSKLGDIRTN